jgi:hypothetical protein
MSEYESFGYGEAGETPGLGESENQQQQGPKWFREGMASLSGQVKELKAENDRLKTAQRQAEVTETLKAKGYAPQAASLYPGEPAGLDDWLTANAAALAKLPAAPGEEAQDQGQALQAPPPTVVSPESQAAMAAMAAAGGSGPGPVQGSDNELAAKLAATTTEEEFAAVMIAHGSKYF